VNNKEIATQARKIAEDLEEKNPRVSRLIFDIISHLGLETTLEYVQKAQALQTEGGMLTINGLEQRTVGGIFFKLLKDDLDPVARRRIFYDNPRLYAQAKKAKLAQMATEKPKPDKKAKVPKPNSSQNEASAVVSPLDNISDVAIPAGLSEIDAAKYEELSHLAVSLRERIARTESSGQLAGLKTLRIMLTNTETQLRLLESS
jgi:hypothetical protein